MFFALICRVKTGESSGLLKGIDTKEFVMGPMITGMFDNRAKAERAVEDLHRLGYSQNDISVMIQDETVHKQFADKSVGNKAGEGLGAGATIGGILGAIIAGL